MIHLSPSSPDYGREAVSVDLGTFIVDVDLVSHGETFGDAVLKADSTIRAAIHEIGGATPGWQTVTASQIAEMVNA